MLALDLTEGLAWALIAAGVVYAVLASRGISTAAVGAALVAVATKALLLDLS